MTNTYRTFGSNNIAKICPTLCRRHHKRSYSAKKVERKTMMLHSDWNSSYRTEQVVADGYSDQEHLYCQSLGQLFAGVRRSTKYSFWFV